MLTNNFALHNHPSPSPLFRKNIKTKALSAKVRVRISFQRTYSKLRSLLVRSFHLPTLAQLYGLPILGGNLGRFARICRARCSNSSAFVGRPVSRSSFA